ncbi:MAG: hypothetical protein OEZ25_08205, partial [Candidatus Bathyarchaeota archaeon]|nr:hypothetical protein [Candidatus Bathyarchaeota archaeon]
MKKRAILTLLFLISSLCLLSLTPHVNAETWPPPPVTLKPRVEVTRLVEVRDWGLVVINDTISIVNNGSAPISKFQVGFPSNFSQHLDYVFA